MAEPGQVQSVHRALDLMEELGHRGEMGVSELAEHMSLPVSTVHNLLRTLARRNYVVSDRGRYSLGAATTVLASETDPARALLPLVRPVLKRLAEGSGHTGTAVVLVGHETRRIGTESGTTPITVNLNQAIYQNPLEIAMGRILVAFQPQPVWADFLDDATGAEDWSQEEWVTELGLIAKTGLAIRRHWASQVSGVGVPVWTTHGQVICALGCAVPSIITPEELASLTSLLWSLTEELSGRLGCDSIPLAEPETAQRLP